jgi:hypothetical protein
MSFFHYLKAPFLKPIFTGEQIAEQTKNTQLTGQAEAQTNLAKMASLRKFNFAYTLTRVILFLAFLPIALPILILYATAKAAFSKT